MSQVTDADATGEQSSEAYIELSDLKKTFAGGSVVAIEDIDLSIGADEFVVLLGPSGCGKTTTLRSIAGLEHPDEGRITVDGEEITHKKPKDRDLAFVFQRIALFPHKSVRANMRFGLDMKTDLSDAEKEERIQDAAEILGIPELLDRRPSELSGGQQQRVSLGRAMVMDPAAFLLDEPFSALDANLRDQMQTEIKKLQRKLHTSMIFVTHDQEEAMTLGDKIVVMNDGHIQQVGTPYEIYNEPVNQFAAEFIGSPSTNMIECQIEETADGLELSNDLFTLRLSEEELERMVQPDGDSVILGIRPEYLQLGAGDGLFDAEIIVIEPKGSQDAIHLQANGTDWTAVTPQHQIEGERERISVDFQPNEMWLFDESGARLL